MLLGDLGEMGFVFLSCVWVVIDVVLVKMKVGLLFVYVWLVGSCKELVFLVVVGWKVRCIFFVLFLLRFFGRLVNLGRKVCKVDFKYIVRIIVFVVEVLWVWVGFFFLKRVVGFLVRGSFIVILSIGKFLFVFSFRF